MTLFQFSYNLLATLNLTSINTNPNLFPSNINPILIATSINSLS